jgi:hypothetical protein
MIATFLVDLFLLTAIDYGGVKHHQGIAKLLVAVCEVLEKAGLCCHFDGVIGPESERIAAGVTVPDCGELIAAGAEYQIDLIMRGQKPLSLPV